MGALKDAMEFYKKRKQEEKDKKLLLSQKSDFHLLETLIQKCNDNPNLKVAVKLTDGTRFELTTYEPHKTRDYEQFNGDFIEIN